MGTKQGATVEPNDKTDKIDQIHDLVLTGAAEIDKFLKSQKVEIYKAYTNLGDEINVTTSIKVRPGEAFGTFDLFWTVNFTRCVNCIHYEMCGPRMSLDAWVEANYLKFSTQGHFDTESVFRVALSNTCRGMDSEDGKEERSTETDTC